MFASGQQRLPPTAIIVSPVIAAKLHIMPIVVYYSFTEGAVTDRHSCCYVNKQVSKKSQCVESQRTRTSSV